MARKAWHGSRHCGVPIYGLGYVEAIGGDYVSVYVATLDDLDPAELVAAPTRFRDGPNDNGWHEPGSVLNQARPISA